LTTVLVATIAATTYQLRLRASTRASLPAWRRRVPAHPDPRRAVAFDLLSAGPARSDLHENLSGLGQSLRKEAPDAKEFAGLKQSGLRRLADAENAANFLESRFDLAYNAAHALSLAALRRAGCREV
jgi:hypothetical protein